MGWGSVAPPLVLTCSKCPGGLSVRPSWRCRPPHPYPVAFQKNVHFLAPAAPLLPLAVGLGVRRAYGAGKFCGTLFRPRFAYKKADFLLFLGPFWGPFWGPGFLNAVCAYCGTEWPPIMGANRSGSRCRPDPVCWASCRLVQCLWLEPSWGYPLGKRVGSNYISLCHHTFPRLACEGKLERATFWPTAVCSG
mgnify:CR=1 FL=1